MLQFSAKWEEIVEVVTEDVTMRKNEWKICTWTDRHKAVSGIHLFYYVMLVTFYWID